MNDVGSGMKGFSSMIRAGNMNNLLAEAVQASADANARLSGLKFIANTDAERMALRLAASELRLAADKCDEILGRL